MRRIKSILLLSIIALLLSTGYSLSASEKALIAINANTSYQFNI